MATRKPVLKSEGNSGSGETDKEGRFRAERLVPGVTYYVMRAGRLTNLGEVSVEPGRNKDMGDVKVKLDK